MIIMLSSSLLILTPQPGEDGVRGEEAAVRAARLRGHGLLSARRRLEPRQPRLRPRLPPGHGPGHGGRALEVGPRIGNRRR